MPRSRLPRAHVGKTVDRGLERGQPRATSARYDAETDAIVVELKTHAVVTLPRKRVAALRGATVPDVSRIQILGQGAALFWPKLDERLELTWILAQGQKRKAPT